MIVHPILHSELAAISLLTISNVTAAKMIFDLELRDKVGIICLPDPTSMFIARTILGNKATSDYLLDDIYVVGVSSGLEDYVKKFLDPVGDAEFVVVFTVAEEDTMEAFVYDDLYEAVNEAIRDQPAEDVKCGGPIYKIEPRTTI